MGDDNLVKVLVCGTRKKGLDKKFVYEQINKYCSDYKNFLFLDGLNIEFVEGCCSDSADEVAEQYAKDCDLVCHHFPSTTGNYLKRNIEMVECCDQVLAFWNCYSYGTAHTIANAVRLGKKVTIIDITKRQ